MYRLLTATVLAIAMWSGVTLLTGTNVRAQFVVCDPEFAAVESAIQAANFLGRNADRGRDRLLDKVAEASGILDAVNQAIGCLSGLP